MRINSTFQLFSLNVTKLLDVNKLCIYTSLHKVSDNNFQGGFYE